MPTWCATAMPVHDVDAEPHRALAERRSGFSSTISCAERVRGEVLHRDGVVALDVQEVVDADDVAVRDLARVAQLVDEPLHHLLVLETFGFRNLRISRSSTTVSSISSTVPKAPLPIFSHVLVAALDHVAGLERGDVEPLALARRAPDAACRSMLGALRSSSERARLGRARGRRCPRPRSARSAGAPANRAVEFLAARAAAALATVGSGAGAWASQLRCGRARTRGRRPGAPARCIASTRISFSGVSSSGSSGSIGRGRRACRSRARRSAASGRARLQHLAAARGSALRLPISASASTARSLTHQSLSRVASIR